MEYLITVTISLFINYQLRRGIKGIILGIQFGEDLEFNSYFKGGICFIIISIKLNWYM